MDDGILVVESWLIPATEYIAICNTPRRPGIHVDGSKLYIYVTVDVYNMGIYIFPENFCEYVYYLNGPANIHIP